MNNYSIRIPDDMMERLRQEASDMDTTVSDLIRGLLRVAIEDNLS